MHWAALIFPVVLPVVWPVTAWAASPDFRPRISGWSATLSPMAPSC